MEDSHICELNLENNVNLFGVFDGHGGKFFELGRECAMFVKENFVKELLICDDFR